MNIAIMSLASYPLKSGAGLNAFRTCVALAGHGFNVKNLTFRWGKHPFVELVDGVPIYRIPYFGSSRVMKLLSYFVILPYYLYLLRCVDVVMIYGTMPGYMAVILFGKLLGKKIILRSTMLGVDDIKSIVNKRGPWLNPLLGTMKTCMVICHSMLI